MTWEKFGTFLGYLLALCMADHYCVNTEDNLVHSVRNSAVR